MRRRKSILPALIIEALAILALAGLYVSSNPWQGEHVVESEMPRVDYLAEDVNEIPRIGDQLPPLPTARYEPPQRVPVSVSHHLPPQNVVHMN